jgi:hypothetical protein
LALVHWLLQTLLTTVTGPARTWLLQTAVRARPTAADARTNLGAAALASPAFTGVPTAATAAFGTSTTQLATTAFVQAALQAVYPVGSIYTSTTATNPGTTFGFGTWAAFGAGKVLVGQDTGDAAFDVLEETGGNKDATLPSHTHTITDPGHFHTSPIDNTFQNAGIVSGGNPGPTLPNGPGVVTDTKTTGITINSAGSSATNANLQPYVVVKMWKRTA